MKWVAVTTEEANINWDFRSLCSCLVRIQVNGRYSIQLVSLSLFGQHIMLIFLIFVVVDFIRCRSQCYEFLMQSLAVVVSSVVWSCYIPASLDWIGDFHSHNGRRSGRWWILGSNLLLGLSGDRLPKRNARRVGRKSCFRISTEWPGRNPSQLLWWWKFYIKSEEGEELLEN